MSKMPASSRLPKRPSPRAQKTRTAAPPLIVGDTVLPATSEPGGTPGEPRTVPLESVVVPQRRIRRDLGDVDALALSLHLHGQLAPVIVYEVADRYHLIAGERRLEATRRLHEARVKAGQIDPKAPATISVIVRHMLAGENPREIELAENAQRRELGDEEEADALIRLVREDGREMGEVAAIAGRSVAYVSKRVRMFEDPALRAALVDRLATPAQAEELLSVPEDQRPEMLQLALSAGWGSKEIREAVQAYLGRPPREATDTRAPVWSAGEDEDYDDADDNDDAFVDLASETGRFRSENTGLGVVLERPRDLTRRIVELNGILRDLRPFQLKPGDDRALRQLWATLRQLAQAPRVPTPPRFPSLAEAESVARRRK